MKRWNVILGVDVSKLTLDVSSAFRGIHLQINNNRQGFAVFMKWCKNHRLDLQSTLVVMEHTGGYEHQFCQFDRSGEIFLHSSKISPFRCATVEMTEIFKISKR